jgi:hypothetical protein
VARPSPLGIICRDLAPEGFDDIASVITPAEIDDVTDEYRRVAGFAISDLQRGVSLLREPYLS